LYRASYGRQFRDCEQVLRFEVSQEDVGVISQLQRNLGVIGSARINATKATVAVTDHTGPYPAYVQLFLRKVAGRWLIEDSTAIPRGQ
jgi:hypothetical protein